MEKYTIKQLRNGKVAAKNDGTLEQLRELLTLMFPKNECCFPVESVMGSHKFYHLSVHTKDSWGCSDQTDLPTQSVKDFLESEWTPKMGDVVLVRESEYAEWVKRIFVAKRDGFPKPFITVVYGYEPSFVEGDGFLANTWAEMKQLPPEEPKEPKIEFSVMVNGQETKLSLEKSEWDKLMSLNEKI